jgi:hypothetical protein
VLSRYWAGVVAIFVLIACGLFILRTALRRPASEVGIDQKG